MTGNPLVLVADDDEDIVTLVGLRLERAGYDVITAKDGVEALERIGTSLAKLSATGELATAGSVRA